MVKFLEKYELIYEQTHCPYPTYANHITLIQKHILSVLNDMKQKEFILKTVVVPYIRILCQKNMIP